MLFIADLHLNRFGDTVPVRYRYGDPGCEVMIPSRLADTLMRVREVVSAAADSGQSVVVGGDVFDNSRPQMWVVSLLFDVFEYARSRGVEMYIIPGNHDCDVHWGPEALGNAAFENVHYLDRPYCMFVDGMKVGFVPHVPRTVVEEVGKAYGFEGWVASVLGDEVEVLVSHAHAQGVKNSSDVEIEAGEAIAFKPELYPKFKVGLFGHIHKPQNVGRVWYPGSVSVCDYSETGDAKGYLALESVSRGPQFIEFLHKGTEYKTVRIDLVNKDVVEFAEDRVKALVGGKLVKVTVFTNDPLKVDEWAIRKALNTHGYVTRFETIIQRDGVDLDVEDEAEDKVSYEALFETWMAGKGVADDRVRAEALELGKTVIARVLARSGVVNEV